MHNNNSKVYFIKKIDKDNFNIKEINQKLNNYFENPDGYFSENDSIFIGKRILINDIRSTLSLPKDRQINNIRSLKKINSMKSNLTRSTNNTYRKGINFKNLSDTDSLKNYKEIIDNKKLKMLFENFEKNNLKLKRNNNFFNSNQETFNNLPFKLKMKLDDQTHYLKIKSDLEKKNNKFSKILSKKIKKEPKDLLMNRIDIFRLKRQIYNDIENNLPIDEKYGKHKWTISLRRPENFKGERDAYVNLGSDKKPLWSIVREKFPIINELCIKPGYNLNYKDYTEFKKNQFLPSSSFKNIKTVENLEQLKIDGKDLYNIEYNREMSVKGKKIFYKGFFDNGNIIMNKDIEDYYPDKTLYKNYKEFNNNNDNNNNIKTIKKIVNIDGYSSS
jgi:hypothetical protein